MSAEIPPLHPPMQELPPTAWEQYGRNVILGTVGAFCAVGLGAAVWFTRRRTEREQDPGEFARAQLHKLEGKPEDGIVLTAASRVVKNYFAAAFGFGGAELTTKEFLRGVMEQSVIATDLRQDTQAFLQECDLRKFSPAAPPAPQPALPRALDIVERAEKARLAQASTQGQSNRETPT